MRHFLHAILVRLRRVASRWRWQAPADHWTDATVMIVNLVGSVNVERGSIEPGDELRDPRELVLSILSGRGRIHVDVVGDSIVGIFRSTGPKSAARAVDVAVEVAARFNERGNPHPLASSVETRIAIATGRIFAGLLGSRGNETWGIVGPAMGLARQLADQCRKTDAHILMCPETARLLGSGHPVRRRACTTPESGTEMIAFELSP